MTVTLARGALRALLCCTLSVAVPADAATTAAAGRAGKAVAAKKKPSKLTRQASARQPGAPSARRTAKATKGHPGKPLAQRLGPAKSPPPAASARSPVQEAPSERTATTACRRDGRIYLLASCET
jgi:hypothetical protein